MKLKEQKGAFELVFGTLKTGRRGTLAAPITPLFSELFEMPNFGQFDGTTILAGRRRVVRATNLRSRQKSQQQQRIITLENHKTSTTVVLRWLP